MGSMQLCEGSPDSTTNSETTNSEFLRIYLTYHIVFDEKNKTSTTDGTCSKWSRNLWTLYFLNSIWGHQSFYIFSWETIGSFQTFMYWFWPYFEKKRKLFKGGGYYVGPLKGNTAFSFGVSKLVVGYDEQDNLFQKTYELLHKGSGSIVYRAAALRSHLIK